MSEVITDKLIDDIIELILDDMDCYHEEDHDEDGTHMSVEYSLAYETKVRGTIGELIDKAMEELQKPGVTEVWIEEKASVISNWSHTWDFVDRKDFIRSLVEEIRK